MKYQKPAMNIPGGERTTRGTWVVCKRLLVRVVRTAMIVNICALSKYVEYTSQR